MADADIPQEDLSSQIPLLRTNFLKEFEASVNDGTYAAADIERVRTEDEYLLRFLKSRGLKDAPSYMDNAFKFRKEYNVNELKADSFSKEMIDSRIIYFEGKDKNDNPIMHFRLINVKSKEYNEELKKYIAFLFEEYHRKEPFHRIILMMDMSGCGVSNIDLDMTKYLIGTVKHYPQLLDYLLIFEMAWLLSAVWRVIKAWLTPEQLKYIKFVKKNDIKEYIDDDNLEDHMK